jgi:hypothetical protein
LRRRRSTRPKFKKRANALKPAVLPGESLRVKVLREGKEAEQGVGYLDDGTMVVVEGGRRLLGETAAVRVTSVLQSPSGSASQRLWLVGTVGDILFAAAVAVVTEGTTSPFYSFFAFISLIQSSRYCTTQLA